ncbi:hypothetical protein GEMRC1_008429 [Eukaryota sp. GEM-RC1]
MRRFKVLKQIGEGTFGTVLKAIQIDSGEVVAVKHMKAKYRSWADCSSLKEIKSLKKLSHPNIIQLKEVILENDELFLVFEYMDCNLYEYLRDRERPLSETKSRTVAYQVLKSLAFCHENGYFHRDLKPENILVNNDISKPVKLADFGSVKTIHSRAPFTEYISTRWYRSPECILTDGYYSFKMDLFALGCILYEILTSRPLFPGKDEFDQITKIHAVLGTPPASVINRFRKRGRHIQNWTFSMQRGCGLEALLPTVSTDCVSLLYQLLAYLPEDRITAKQALKHDWFSELRRKDESPTDLSPTLKKDYGSTSNSTLPSLHSRTGGVTRADPLVSGLINLKRKERNEIRNVQKPMPSKTELNSNKILPKPPKPLPLSNFTFPTGSNANRVALARAAYAKPQPLGQKKKKKECVSWFGSCWRFRYF